MFNVAANAAAGAFTFSRIIFRIFIVIALIPATNAANVAVDRSGQPSYSYPINVPPGISGMQPNFSIYYAGGGINGPLGHGWSVQGISTITRCQGNIYTDGMSTPVKYIGADRLCLDGQRLIRVNASDQVVTTTDDGKGLSSGYAEYRTEKDSYSRIRAYGNTGNLEDGPTTFTVWTKAGQVYEYGAANATDARQTRMTAQGKTAIMLWPVARIKDTVGNYMDFYYDLTTNSFGSGPAGGVTPGTEWNIKTVKYTGSISAAPYNRVEFEYENKARSVVDNLPIDAAEAYQAGSKTVSTRRLKRVKTYVGTDASSLLTGTIILSYEHGGTDGVTGRSRLQQIKQCFGTTENKCLEPTSFTYSNAGAAVWLMADNFPFRSYKFINAAGDYGVLTGDFNGDGRADILRWSSLTDNGTEDTKNVLMTSNGNGLFTKQESFTLPHLLFRKDGCFFSYVADMNSDGLQDIVRITASKSRDGNECNNAGGGTAHIFYNNGNLGFIPVQVVDEASAAILLHRVQSKDASRYYCVGGEISIIVPPPVEGESAKMIRVMDDTGTGEGEEDPPVDPPQPLPPDENPPPGNPGTDPGSDPNACPTPQQQVKTDGWTYGANFYFADINGDGLPDLIKTELPTKVSKPPGSDIAAVCEFQCTWVYLNQGGMSASFKLVTSNIPSQTVYSDPGKPGDMMWPKHVNDIDGDGIADLVGVGKLGTYSQFGSWRSVGSVVSPLPSSVSFEYVNGSVCDDPIDFNGDGRKDCLRREYVAANNSLSVSKGTTTELVATFNIPATSLKPSETATVGNGLGVIIADFNGDGREDILRWHDDRTKNYLFWSRGSGQFSWTTEAWTTTQWKMSDGSFDAIVADFLGKGSLEILRVSTAAPTNTDSAVKNNFYMKANLGVTDQLLSSKSSTGLKTVLSWGNIANSSQYSSDRSLGLPTTYPLVDVTFPMPVVLSTTSDTGTELDETLVTRYAYRGLKVDAKGRGMLGFRETRVDNPVPGNRMTNATEILQTWPYIGVARWTESRLGSWSDYDNKTTISRTENIYCEKAVEGSATGASLSTPCAPNAGAKRVRPYVYKTTETGFDLEGSLMPKVTTTNEVDWYGNPTKVIVTSGAKFDSAGTDRVVTKTNTNTYDNIVDNDRWILGRLMTAQVTSQVPNILGGTVPSYGTAPNAGSVDGVGITTLGGAKAAAKAGDKSKVQKSGQKSEKTATSPAR